MINQAYSVLYGYAGLSPSGVWSGLTEQRAPEQLRAALGTLRGLTQESADQFACLVVKIVDASSYRAVLEEVDGRMTLRPHEMPCSADAVDMLSRVLGAPSTVVEYALRDELFRDGLDSKQAHERAAAILAGLIRRLGEVSS